MALGETVTDLAAFRAQGLESLGVARGISFQPGGPGTEVFTVPHALLLSDDKNTELAKPLDFVEIAKTILNTDTDPDAYYRFRAAGGQAGDVMIAWRHLSLGLDVPKSAKP
ncbi:hypothetical protein [Nocardia terpenica]|uniref:Uncharacterized protein n=1 Tax=Nocardia terpenica TaxID=455432 RepID=A0A164JVB8_9NOCA|nr:hypothetical protein [Nocardia terpenica]KZM70756.1 hypothetical protein AWN90_40055 [Nocardia terpenica]